MTPSKFHDDFIPQDTAEDDSSAEANTGLPLSEAEIEDLLYGDGRSTGERLELLRALRDDMADRAGGDLGEDDPRGLIDEIEDRIAELEGAEQQGDEAGVLDADPLAHRETLAPDSDELDALEQEDEDSLDEEDEWLDEEAEAEENGAPAAPDDEDDEDDDALH